MRPIWLLPILSASLLWTVPASSQIPELDNDPTVITDCTKVLPNVSIKAFAAIKEISCKHVTEALTGARIKDLRLFQKAGAGLSLAKCGPDKFEDSLKDMLEVVRLRGQQDKPDLWIGTANLAARTCRLYKVQLSDLLSALKAAGPKASQLTDNELETAVMNKKLANPLGMRQDHEPGKTTPKSE